MDEDTGPLCGKSKTRTPNVFVFSMIFFPAGWLGKFNFGTTQGWKQLKFRPEQPLTFDMGLPKFQLLTFLGLWEIKDGSFSGLFISSFFSLPFCCFTSKTPILSLKKKSLMSMPGGYLVYVWRCFRSVKFLPLCVAQQSIFQSDVAFKSRCRVNRYTVNIGFYF